MTKAPRMRPRTRATRVNVQGRVSVIIQLENGRKISAKLQKLSVTGGLWEIAMYLEERSKVDLSIPIGVTMVRPKAEILFPMCGAHGYLQPFRFTRLWAEERQMLETEITELLKPSMARPNAGQGTVTRPGPTYVESL
jgi:hypothetical protein